MKKSFEMSDKIKENKYRKGSTVAIGTKRRVSVRSLDHPPTVPDGGYGWVVVTAAFCVQMTLGGFLYSFGIYFVEFIKVFKEDRGKTAWIGATLFGGFALTGPFTSILLKLCGCRLVVILGSIQLGVALFCCAFCQSVVAIIGVLGVLGGIGLGLLYLPTVAIVGFYFEKRRSLAIAMCTSGTGVGGVVFPVLMDKLIEHYGWRGSLWVMSGLFVQCIFFGALLRPLTKYDMKKCIAAWQQKRIAATQSINFTAASKGQNINESKQGAFRYVNEGFEEDKMAENLSINKEDTVVDSNRKVDVNSDENGHAKTINMDAKADSSGIRSMCSSLTKYADIWLLTNPVFIIYAVSSVLGMAGFQVSSTFLPDFATSIGVSRSNISFLLSISGFFNTFCKLILGWICDRPSVDPIRMYSIIIIFSGVMAIALPHLKIYILLALYTTVLGISIGAIALLGSVNLVDLLGMEKMPGALGIIMLLSGVGNLLAMPLAGLLVDVSGSYLVTFSIFGSFSVLSGLLCLPLRHFARCIFGDDANS